MRVPIVCVDARVRQYAQTFSDCFSCPQYQHFVIVLVGLLLCRGKRTLTGLLSCLSVTSSLASLSRFLSEAPWNESELACKWRERFDLALAPLVAQRHADYRAARPRRLGRPKASVVTGYLIGDDSTCHKMRGKKMEGIGNHYSTTASQTVKGHSLVQSLYVLLGRRCPLKPQLYRQKKSCEAEDVTFRSKVVLMVAAIREFQPVATTRTHVLLDAWYSAKVIWKAARERGFQISTGLRGNRLVRIRDKGCRAGWQWLSLDAYVKRLKDDDYQEVVWPRQDGSGRTVYVHVFASAVQKLGRVQLIVVREKRDGKLTEPRFWASSDLGADTQTLIGHLAVRWDIEVLFADTKELLGLDHYQLMSATALLRFWTLVLAAYVFLEEQRASLEQDWQRPVSIGQTQQEVQRVHWFHLISWMCHQLQADHTPATLFRELAA
jgi:DDE superfamily endonuclease